MATKSGLRFTIEAQGIQRSIFSVIEKKSANEKVRGTLIIRPKQDVLSRPALHQSIRDRPVRIIQSQKYTLHPSSDSLEKVNTFHSTTTYTRGPPTDWRHLTKAIKSGTKFALLYVKRCSNLAKPHFVSNREASQTKSLGIYDPAKFTLQYAIVVSAPNVEFKYERIDEKGFRAKNEINLMDHVFDRFRLTVMWSFLSLRSHSSSLIYHHETVTPTTEQEHARMEGMTADECTMLFSEQCDVLEREQQMLMQAEVGNFGQLLIPLQRWFRDGLTQTLESEKYEKALQARVLNL
jgi:hypothetical protein